MHYYQPARLVRGRNWYIIYYQVHPDTNERVRFRESYDLNRIPSLKLRLKTAIEIIDKINSMLPDGWPFYNVDLKEKIPLVDAIQIAKNAKCTTDREKTIVTYKSISKIFCEWAASTGLAINPLESFTKTNAYEFLDWAEQKRGVSAATYNNYVIILRALFNELINREMISKNPFAMIKPKKTAPKGRRALTGEEKAAIIQYAFENDKPVCLAILLLYYTFIRPVEMRRLRLSHFDLNRQLIIMPGVITKNKDNESVTIPDVLIDFLRDLKLNKYPSNYFLFGKDMLPSTNKPCGHHTINRRHSYILKRLQEQKILSNTDGISIYSWKDTGAADLVTENINIMEIMLQLRHKNLATTQRYLASFNQVNKEIKHRAKQLLQ